MVAVSMMTGIVGSTARRDLSTWMPFRPASGELACFTGVQVAEATVRQGREQAGAALVRAEQYDLAREFLQKAAPGRPAARLDLAIALFFTEGPKQALEVIEKAPPRALEKGVSWMMEVLR